MELRKFRQNLGLPGSLLASRMSPEIRRNGSSVAVPGRLVALSRSVQMNFVN